MFWGWNFHWADPRTFWDSQLSHRMFWCSGVYASTLLLSGNGCEIGINCLTRVFLLYCYTMPTFLVLFCGGPFWLTYLQWIYMFKHCCWHKYLFSNLVTGFSSASVHECTFPKSKTTRTSLINSTQPHRFIRKPWIFRTNLFHISGPIMCNTCISKYNR